MAHGFSGGGDGRWPSMSRAGIGCVLGVLALAVATAWAADASTLRYGFKAGQKYIYEVRIEGNSPDEIETVTGQSTYTVKSVDTSGQMTLANSANLTTVNKLKEARVAPMAPRRFGPPGLFHGPNYNSATDLTINPQGKVIKHVGENQLPYMLGNLFELLIDPLPAGDQMQWQVERDIALTKHLENFRFGPPFMRDREASRSATETRSYTRGVLSGQMLKIAKKYILATDEKINDLPVLEFTGQGAIDFDTQAGVVAAVDMKYAIKFNSENMVVTIPVKLSAKLLSTEEAQAVAQEQADKAQAARAAAAEAARPKPIDDAGVSAALSELSQSDAFKVRSALDRLARAIPLENRRREVAAAVEPLAADRDQFTAMAALKVLAAWGGRENVPALIAAMNSQEFFVRTGAMAALGNIKDPRGAEAVAKQAIPFHGRMQASQALQAMGDVAEPYVLPLLKNSDWGVRMEACKILGVIGTDASVAPLRQASSDENGLVKREADNALRSIEGRLKQPQKARPVVHPTA